MVERIESSSETTSFTSVRDLYKSMQFLCPTDIRLGDNTQENKLPNLLAKGRIR